MAPLFKCATVFDLLTQTSALGSDTVPAPSPGPWWAPPPPPYPGQPARNPVLGPGRSGWTRRPDTVPKISAATLNNSDDWRDEISRMDGAKISIWAFGLGRYWLTHRYERTFGNGVNFWLSGCHGENSRRSLTPWIWRVVVHSKSALLTFFFECSWKLVIEIWHFVPIQILKCIYERDLWSINTELMNNKLLK